MIGATAFHSRQPWPESWMGKDGETRRRGRADRTTWGISLYHFGESQERKNNDYKQMTTSADNSLKTSWPRREKNGSITGACTGNNPLTLLNTTVLWYKNHQPIRPQIENQAPPCSSEDKVSIIYVTNKLSTETLGFGTIVAIIR